MNKTVPPASWTPPWPAVTALGLSSLWIAILSIPMWSGRFAGGPYSDQYPSGLAIRSWAAEHWRQAGSMPQWNPDLFGGIPIFAGFGDVFYPTAWLRLILPTVTAMNIGFAVHYILAGFFLYLFLRLVGVAWIGAVVGAAAYQLSGVIVSYVSPGHDGKLYVTALLPVMLIGLFLAIRRNRPEGYALLGLVTGLALLSPQYQMAQYALIVSGLFTLYLVFGDPEGPRGGARLTAMGLALAAVALGFGIAALQLLPFAQYVPFSPRASAGGYEWSTSYAIPWSHVPEFFFSGFAGSNPQQTYWGPNPLKLHSEYLGLPVIALAVLGAGGQRRALTRWLVGIGTLMLLVAMGSATPFYRLWYAVVPYVSKTRAPGMALYAVALVLAILAAFGAERLERREGKGLALGALIAAGVVAVLGVAGILGGIAASYAPRGLPPAAVEAIRWGAMGSAVGLAAMGGLALAYINGKVPAALFALGLPLLIGADLWRDGRSFWMWSRPGEELLAKDPVILHMGGQPKPFRVLELGAYPSNILHAQDIPQALGYHGNQIRTYDELWGRQGDEYRFLGSSQLWKLMGVRFVVLPDTVTLAGYHRVLGPTRVVTGGSGVLYEADTIPPYARVVPGAIKIPAEQVVPTILNPRLDLNRIVLLDSSDAIPVAPLTALPDPSPSRATVKGWEPGKISVELSPPPPAPSYLLLAENWYPDWHATVNGQPVAPVRGNHTLLTVPVPAGASEIRLEFRSSGYRTGRLITLVSLLILVIWAVLPRVVSFRNN